MKEIQGITVRIFLPQGTGQGLKIAEIPFNWTGKAFWIHRYQLNLLLDRDELENPGLYILIAQNDEINSRYSMYVGETENVKNRLKQHLEKDFWNQVIVFTNSDENLTKAHVKYLEYSVCKKLADANRVILENTQIPNENVLPESEKANMDEFVNKIYLIIETFGFPGIFEKIRSKEISPDVPSSENKMINDYTFQIKLQRINATMTPDLPIGFKVIKGSELAKTSSRWETDPMLKSARLKRDQLITEGLIEQKGDSIVLLDDVWFTSPSAASNFVVGRKSNGRTSWVTEEGTNYGDIEDSLLEKDPTIKKRGPRYVTRQS